MINFLIVMEISRKKIETLITESEKGIKELKCDFDNEKSKCKKINRICK